MSKPSHRYMSAGPLLSLPTSSHVFIQSILNCCKLFHKKKKKMHRVLFIGDSNLYRNATEDVLKARIGRDVTVLKATKQLTFSVCLNDVSRMEGEVVLVSALPNLVCDAASESNLSDLATVVTESTSRYVSDIAKQTTKFKTVLMVPPLFRTTPAWFQDQLRTMTAILTALIQTYPNMQMLPEFKVQVTDLLSDGVHLHSEAGTRFVDYLVNCVKDVIGAATPALTEPTIADVMKLLNETLVPRTAAINPLQSRVDKVEQTLASRMVEDDVILARHSDELDQIKNEKWTNRVVIVNYPGKDYPTTLADRKAFLVEKFRGLIEQILGEIVFDIFPRASTAESDTVPPFEIKFPSEATCRKFKLEAHKKIKEDPSTFGEAGVHPKLTLASRVRVEVLRAISRKVNGPNQSAYCPIFNTRPILHVGPLVDGKVQRAETLTYVDAVLRFKHLLTINDLVFAYRRVGYGFHNALRQTFIVLRDEDRKHAQSLPTTQGTSRGTKRTNDGSSRGRGAPRGKRSR